MPLRKIPEDVLVRQIAAGRGEGREPAPNLLKIEKRQLPTQGVSNYLAARAAEPPAELIQLSLQVRIEANRHGCHP